jgi:hypothetical protein
MSSFGLPSARAEASRRNGAKSKGPKTSEGKARSAQNALKHGLRAQKHMVLPGEGAAAFEALEAALIEELAPEGALQAALAQRVVSAVWRLSRAERLEAELFEKNHFPGGNLGLALIRDCNGARSFDTLLRYRGGTLAELWRALRTLKALQAERAARPEPATASERLPLTEPHEVPIEPESRANLEDSGPSWAASEPAPLPAARASGVPASAKPTTPAKLPDEPERRKNPGARPAPPFPSKSAARNGSASLLAGTALVPIGRRSSGA